MDTYIIYECNKGIKKLMESLAKLNLELTPTAIKQLGYEKNKKIIRNNA